MSALSPEAQQAGSFMPSRRLRRQSSSCLSLLSGRSRLPQNRLSQKAARAVYHSRSGVCTRHHYWGKTHPKLSTRAASGKRKKRVAPAGSRFSIEETSGSGTPLGATFAAAQNGGIVDVSIRLTESQCDAMYRRCSLQQKGVALATALHDMFTHEI